MSKARAKERIGAAVPTISPSSAFALLLAAALTAAFVRPGCAGEAGDFLPKAAPKLIAVGGKTVRIPVPPRVTHMDPGNARFMHDMRLEAVYTGRSGKQFALCMAGTSPDLENETFDAEMLEELIDIIKASLDETGVPLEVLLEEPAVMVMKIVGAREENGGKIATENAEAFMELGGKFVYLRVYAEAESSQSLDDTAALIRQWAADVFKANGEAVPANLEP